MRFTSKKFKMERTPGKYYPINFVATGKYVGTAYMKDELSGKGFYGKIQDLIATPSGYAMEGSDLKKALDAECLRNHHYQQKMALQRKNHRQRTGATKKVDRITADVLKSLKMP